MDRVVVGTQGTISMTFQVAGVGTPVDSGNVVVTGVGLDGSTLFTGNAGSGGSGVYTYTVAPTFTTRPDQVIVTWSGMWVGVTQTTRTQLAIVGDTYFTIAQLQTWEPAVATGYAYADLERARAWAETRAEGIMGRSYVRSAGKISRTCSGESELRLPERDVRSIRAVSLDGVAQDTSGYILRHKATLPTVYGAWPEDVEATIIYEHGAAWTPEDIARTVAILTKEYAVRSITSTPDRAQRWMPAESGGMFQLAIPEAGATGIPIVDSVLKKQRSLGIA